MNILEAIDEMAHGAVVSHNGQKHRMKITSWANTKIEDDEPEWNIFYWSGTDWRQNNHFSLEEIISEEWLVVEEGED